MTTSAPRPLADIRLLIDALDHDLLQLLARRMALVAEAAAFKQQQGLLSHDREREQAVLADRTVRARALGLPEADVAAIFQLLLESSRRHQESLRRSPAR